MYINFQENLFLGKQELVRFQSALGSTKGSAKFLQKNDIYVPGIIKSKTDLNFLNFKVEAGSQPKTIKLIDSIAVDVDGLLIFKEAQDNISIPEDGNWYWVKVSHLYSPIEEGVVSIAADGVLTGTNTKFTEILRGVPNNPNKIKFYGSGNNIHNYEVVSVDSNTSALLSGDFVPESNLRFSVVGSFTEDFVPPLSYENTYQYDSCVPFTVGLGIIEESNGQVPVLTEGKEFFIARVKVANSNILIEDKRTQIFQTKAEYLLSNVDKKINNLLGVESVKWDIVTSPKYRNQINVGWGFRSNNWTIESTLRKITISSGNGGKIKDTSYFNDGDFDGFRVYNQLGSYYNILESWKSGSQINLILDNLDPSQFVLNTEISIVPNVEEIEFKVLSNPIPPLDITFPFEPAEIYKQLEFTRLFPISEGFGDLWVRVPHREQNDPYSVLIQYRYKSVNNYSDWIVLSDDEVKGYYDETSFLANGELKPVPGDRNEKTYTDGLIELIPDPNSYANKLWKVDKNDIFEVENISLPNNGVINLIVGESKYYQHVTGTASLDSDVIFNLSSVGGRNGNEFVIHFELNSDSLLNGYSVKIIQDYVNGSSTPALKTISIGDIYAMLNQDGGIKFECIFDGQKWIVSQNYDLGVPGEVKHIHGVKGNLFNTNGWGKVKGLFGYALCESGFNIQGVPNISGRSIIGTGTYTEGSQQEIYQYGNGDIGGVAKHKLTINELPKILGNELETSTDGVHTHDVNSQAYSGESAPGPKHIEDDNGGGWWVTAQQANLLRNSGSHKHTVKLPSVGNDAKHENRSPFIALLTCKKMY